MWITLEFPYDHFDEEMCSSTSNDDHVHESQKEDDKLIRVELPK